MRATGRKDCQDPSDVARVNTKVYVYNQDAYICTLFKSLDFCVDSLAEKSWALPFGIPIGFARGAGVQGFDHLTWGFPYQKSKETGSLPAHLRIARNEPVGTSQALMDHGAKGESPCPVDVSRQ